MIKAAAQALCSNGDFILLGVPRYPRSKKKKKTMCGWMSGVGTSGLDTRCGWDFEQYGRPKDHGLK